MLSQPAEKKPSSQNQDKLRRAQAGKVNAQVPPMLTSVDDLQARSHSARKEIDFPAINRFLDGLNLGKEGHIRNEYGSPVVVRMI